MKKEMEVNGLIVQLKKHIGNDYFSLTDIAKSQGENIRPADLIKNWIRTCNFNIRQEQPWNLLGHGKNYTIHNLKWSNLTTLNRKLDFQLLVSVLVFGKSAQMLLDLLLFKENMVGLTLIKTLLSNFVQQSTQFSSCF